MLSDLLDYYETHYKSEYDRESADKNGPKFDSEYQGLYEICRSIIDREKPSGQTLEDSALYIKEKFSSDYVSKQIDLLMRARTENPTVAIGMSKELIESCCKTILENQGVAIQKTWDVPRLTKETAKLLIISGSDIEGDTKENKIVKQILGSLQGLATGVSEFRNESGTSEPSEQAKGQRQGNGLVLTIPLNS